MPMCDEHLSAGDVPLYDDLSNASIATCKGYRPHLNSTRPDPYAPHIVLPPNLPTPIESNYTTNATNVTYIYDPVLKTREPLLDHQHQVATHQEGHVDPTPFAGPIQTLSQERWVELPTCTGAPGEIWLKDDLANASAATCKIDPYNRPNKKKREADAALDSMTPKAMAQIRWVELPDCTGQASEIVLAEDLMNATQATCKPNANSPPKPKAVDKKESAKKALDSMTPKALTQQRWVELPDC